MKTSHVHMTVALAISVNMDFADVKTVHWITIAAEIQSN